jgi:hypothetical protein
LTSRTSSTSATSLQSGAPAQLCIEFEYMDFAAKTRNSLLGFLDVV